MPECEMTKHLNIFIATGRYTCSTNPTQMLIDMLLQVAKKVWTNNEGTS